jgi:hypothetical protein
MLACFLTAASSSRAQQAPFITTPPTISGVTTSAQAQVPLSSPTALNQAAMTQIINRFNQNQSQLNAAAAQTSAQRPLFVPRNRPLFVPRNTIIRRAK